MGEGAILESGTHDELLRRQNGPYARLVAAQRLKEAQVEEDESGSSTADDAEDIEKAVREEVQPIRRGSTRSLASEVIEKNRQHQQEGKKDYNMFYLFKRIGSLNPPGYKEYVIGTIAAICTGMVYPAFGLVYAKALDGFALPNPLDRRHAGDRNALWVFLIAIISALAICIQNGMFNHAAAQLSAVLRIKSFKAIVSQDIEFFDKEENSTGTLTTGLADNPQKIFGLAGITLAAYVSHFHPGCSIEDSRISQHHSVHRHYHWWFCYRSRVCMEAFPRWHRYVYTFHMMPIIADTMYSCSLLSVGHLRGIHSFACRCAQGSNGQEGPRLFSTSCL